MGKKRKTELDIDLDLNVEELIEKEEPPPPSEEPQKKEPKEPRFQLPQIKLPEIPPKILILGGAGVLIFMLIIGIIYYISQKPEPPPPEIKEPVEEEAAPSFNPVPNYEFTPFFFPLESKDNKQVFLKIAFSFDLSNELVLKEIEQNIALLRANLSFVLKKKSVNDLKSDPDRTKLGQEIINILNRSLQKGTAAKVYFTQFLIK